MGNRATLEPFVADDRFLRRVAKKRQIRNGIVTEGAFEDRHPTLSFTYQDEELKSDTGLTRYQFDKKLPSGDLPGLCVLSFQDLTVLLEPPLPPRHDIDHEDEQYGLLHCCTDSPRDEDHREKMAKLATRNGVLREFVRASKRPGHPQ